MDKKNTYEEVEQKVHNLESEQRQNDENLSPAQMSRSLKMEF